MSPVVRKIVIVGIGLAVVGSGVAAAALLSGSDEPRVDRREAALRSRDRDARAGKDDTAAADSPLAEDPSAVPGRGERGASGGPGGPSSTCTMTPIQLLVKPSATLAPGQDTAIDATTNYSCGPGPVTVRIAVTVTYGVHPPFPVQLPNDAYQLQGSSTLAQTAQFPAPGFLGSYVVTVRALVHGTEIARGTATFEVTGTG